MTTIVRVAFVLLTPALGLLVAESGWAQGCTAARGCPTVAPLIPGGNLGAGESTNFYNFAAPANTDQFASYSPVEDQSSEPSVEVSRSQALIRVNVPDPAARVWFQGAATQRQGSSRLFLSPTLSPGREYRYSIRCVWQQEGTERSALQRVVVRPGREVVVDF